MCRYMKLHRYIIYTGAPRPHIVVPIVYKATSNLSGGPPRRDLQRFDLMAHKPETMVF